MLVRKGVPSKLKASCNVLEKATMRSFWTVPSLKVRLTTGETVIRNENLL